MSFPRGPEDLTTGWLSDALGAEVASFETTPIGVGVGMMGQLVQVRTEGAEPKSVVAKFPTADDGARMNVAGPLRLYQREAQFYRDLADSVPVGTPTVHAAEFDEATGDFVLLLEDLSTLRCADQIAGCSIGDARTVIDQIADHHAHYSDPARLDAIGWLPQLDDPVMQAVVNGMAKQSLPGFYDVFGAELTPEFRNFYDRLPETAVEFMGGTEEGTATMAHVDLRLDNIFFGDEHRPMVLIDWQLSAKAGFAYDVGYFLSQSLDTDVRRQHEAALVERYLSRLESHGVDVDRTGFDIDYRRTVAFCTIYPVNVAGSVEMANDRAVDLVRMLYERAMAAVHDHDALDVWF